MCDSIEKLSTRVNLQLLWVIISGICSFWPFCISFNTQGVPKSFKICDLSLMSDIIKSLVRNYFSVQVCSLGVTFREIDNCDPFWPLVCPKKDQNLWFVLNEWQYKICDQKCYLCTNFQYLGIIYRGMDNFWPFCPALISRVSQKGSKNVIWQKYMTQSNSSCKIMYLCKLSASRYHFIGNSEFWPPLLTSFWPPGARKWRSHGKSLWVKSSSTK